MKTVARIGLPDVQAVYRGPEGALWELVMGQQIHIGGFQSSTVTAMAQCWEPAQLQSWMPVELEANPVVIERRPGPERQ
jgi:hypothetical protein